MNKQIKSLFVACVATIGLGLHNGTAEAVFNPAIQKGGSHSVVLPTNRATIEETMVKPETIHNTLASIGEILIPPAITIHSAAKPVLQTAANAIVKIAQPEETKTDKSKNSKEPAASVTDEAKDSIETAVSETETAANNSIRDAGSETETSIEPIETAAQTANPAVETPMEEPAAPGISISNEEKDFFARLVEAEAKGEPFEGKVAVATVVLNRVESPEFPDTVTEVVKENTGNTYAFSPVQNGEINKPASEESKQAVEEALKRENTLGDAIYFYNPDIATDNWIRSRDAIKTIGNHVFAK